MLFFFHFREKKHLMKVPAKEIDTGAGFFLDEEDELELKSQHVEYVKGKYHVLYIYIIMQMKFIT